MREQLDGKSKVFHMDLVEIVARFILFPICVVVSVILLQSDPVKTEKLFIVVIIIGYSLFYFVSAFRMPRKVEFTNGEIIVKYFGWKSKMKADDIKSFSFESGRYRRRTSYFVNVMLNNEGKLRIRDIKAGGPLLIKALEEFTGKKSTYDVPGSTGDENTDDFQDKDQGGIQPEPLSELTEQLIQKIFPPEERMEVRQLLINHCGNNVYAHEHKDKYELEGLRFAVLKVSKGEMKSLRRAIKTLDQDFRDIYAESGFIGEKAEEKREKWVQTLLNKE